MYTDFEPQETRSDNVHVLFSLYFFHYITVKIKSYYNTLSCGRREYSTNAALKKLSPLQQEILQTLPSKKTVESK